MSRGFFVEANVCGSDVCVSGFAVLYEQKKKNVRSTPLLFGRPPLIERLRRIYLSRAARKVPPFRRPSLSSASDPAQSVKDGPRPDLTASRAQPQMVAKRLFPSSKYAKCGNGLLTEVPYWFLLVKKMMYYGCRCNSFRRWLHSWRRCSRYWSCDAV